MDKRFCELCGRELFLDELSFICDNCLFSGGILWDDAINDIYQCVVCKKQATFTTIEGKKNKYFWCSNCGALSMENRVLIPFVQNINLRG